MDILKRKNFIFLVAGFAGFATEALIIRLGMEIFDQQPVLLRAISFPTAVLITWIINRRFGFRVAAPASFFEIARYFNTNILAQATNFIVFTALIYAFSFFRNWPEIALVAGTGVSMLISFKLYSTFVFGDRR